jgi:hypothetical protein
VLQKQADGIVHGERGLQGHGLALTDVSPDIIKRGEGFAIVLAEGKVHVLYRQEMYHRIVANIGT